jgi:hypothetical protein
MKVSEFPWEWVSSDLPLTHKKIDVAITKPIETKRTSIITKSNKRRFHPALSIWMKDDSSMGCKVDDANLYWCIVLMMNGGFIRKPLYVIQREVNCEIARKTIELSQQMKLIPIGSNQKEM